MRTISGLPEDLDPSRFSDEVLNLIPGLMSDGSNRRIESREKLAAMGPAILDQIYHLFDSSYGQIRWEAAQILKAMASREAIPQLIELLTDKDDDVRWIAAEALIKRGRDSLVPLLKLVIEHVENPNVRDGAHHVLSHLLTKAERKEHESLLHGLVSYKRYGDSAPHWADQLLNHLEAEDKNRGRG